MEKSFDPKSFEARWSAFWQEKEFFKSDPDSGKPSFTVVIPPPNITGRLHVGHGLNNTLIDVIVRWRRMSGYDALYLPGTDHASIGTHVMIERALEKEGLTREELGREEFLKRAWAWNEKFGGAIREQLKRLGASCDWSRERFTLDEGLSRAVREVFVRLHEEGLIYRKEYMVNWCPRCRTAVSDLEVVHKESAGSMWTVKYELVGGGEIRVATTRPETILGDVAVAVHPDDERYRELIGREAILPVIGRHIKILADSFVDPEFGTGAVKITPAHDPADFEVGERHGLAPIKVINEIAGMTEAAGEYAGLDRFVCRKKILERLKEEGALIITKDHVSQVGHCDRCDTIVEPSISLQWFVEIKPLADPALAAVEDGRIKIVPEMWKKTYREWMLNIHDWCISRQLWWGHQIPAWYCSACDHITVAREDPTQCSGCGGGELRQDPDILDTWFSSGLWAFSTLGWPEKTKDLKAYYPTNLLVTGYDIIFFWIARMIMMGMKFMDDIPFSTVYFTGLVRDAHGNKMSKTKGNAVDVLEAIDTYGADPLRFTFCALAVPGSDIPLAEERILGYRSFCNKIWNAVRFAKQHLPESGPLPQLPAKDRMSLADKWILSSLDRVSEDVGKALERFRFDDAANRLYQFTWHEFCDWYLESAKPSLNGPEPQASQAVLANVLDKVLKLLHPIIPFVTEEMWSLLPHDGESLTVASFPVPSPGMRDDLAEEQMQYMIESVTNLRNARAAAGLPPSSKVSCTIVADEQTQNRLVNPTSDYIRLLARLESLEILDARPDSKTPAGVVGGTEILISAPTQKAAKAGRDRLEKELEKVVRDLDPWTRKLANENFVSRAKPEVVEKARRIHRELSEKQDRIRQSLASGLN
jgi:valyl-tRNA synthetase